MANINTELEQIRKAVYGREVRGSIANAIELINKEQVNTSTAQTNLDSKFNQLIINAGNSNAEVVAARVKADGTQFNTLGKRLDGIDSQLDTNVKYPTPKKYGAKGDGVTDDTQAIIKALNNENHISISDGIYKITGNIKLAPGKTISGDSTGTILIDSANNFTVFGITYLNEVYGFNIKQTNESWGGNVFEVSSSTLEDTDAPKYVNLRNKIHDINLETNSNHGTFIEISAYKYDDVDANKQYRVYGLWNNNVYNIQHKGYLEYFCRTYCYKKTGTSEAPWITDNKFSNINGDYYGYGWFGSKNKYTKLNLEYSNYNINVFNSVIQCYTKSKNFAYITGGYTKFINCIPYDWSSANETHQNAFAIRYSADLPRIVIDGTSGNFDVENYNLSDKDYIINQCILNSNGESNYNTKNSFQIGYFGGTTYPKYVRIARFYPHEASYSCNIRFHIESSDRICSNYSLTYLKSSKKLTSKYENDNVGISFLYNEDSRGYVNIYMKITNSALPWFMSYDTPPSGSSSKAFIYMSLIYLESLDESGLKECVPIQKELMLPNLNNITATASNGGLIGYDSSKGMLGFGRKHYGVSYIPVIETQEFTASSVSETVVFANPKWGLTPKIIIQPLSDVSLIPYPSNVSTANQSFTINKAEVGKKYLIIIIYT